MLALVSWHMRGSSEKRRTEMPVYVVAALEISPQELNSERCTTFLGPLSGNEKYAISLLFTD